MKSFTIAVAAFAVSATAVGNAVVKNMCSSSVAVQYVPSANPGYAEVDSTLEPNGTPFSAPWESLPNGAGWSIKLIDPTNSDLQLQFEYTYTAGDADFWYDISEVNGLDAFGGDWSIEGSSGCDSVYKAYLYPGDNLKMQDTCSVDSTVTVTLCANEDSSASSSSSSAAASTTASSTSTSASSATSTSSSTTSTTAAATSAASSTTSVESSSTTKNHNHTWTGAVDKAVVAAATTLATSVIATTSAGDDLMVTVTTIETVVATATVLAQKRAEHVHEHAARHPHGRH